MSLLANKRSEIHPFWTQARRAPGRLGHVTPTKAVILAHPQDVLRPAGSSPRFVRDSLPPAPLLSVANRPLVAHAVSWLQQAGVREAAVIVPGELAEAVRRAVAGAAPTLDISWLEQVPDETLPWSLGRVSDFLGGEQFVLHMADSVAKQSLASLMSEADDDDVEASSWRTTRTRSGSVRWSSCGQAETVASDAKQQGSRRGSLVRRRHRGSPNPRHSYRLRGRSACRGHREPRRLRSNPGVRDWWRFAAEARTIFEGNRFALEGQAADLTEAQVVDSKIRDPSWHTRWLALIEHRSRSSVIGAGAHLARLCRAYTSIGDDVLVEGAEIEHSVILAGACISHSGSPRGQRSRPQVQVFRDFRLPRALRLTLGEAPRSRSPRVGEKSGVATQRSGTGIGLRSVQSGSARTPAPFNARLRT